LDDPNRTEKGGMSNMKRKWIVAVLAAALLALPLVGLNLAQACDQLNPAGSAECGGRHTAAKSGGVEPKSWTTLQILVLWLNKNSLIHKIQVC
jgi:hypothetical protein